MGDIFSKVQIKEGLGDTEGNATITIEFLGCYCEIYGERLTERELSMFKRGVISERERVWDRLADILDKETCKKCEKIKYDELFNVE